MQTSGPQDQAQLDCAESAKTRSNEPSLNSQPPYHNTLNMQTNYDKLEVALYGYWDNFIVALPRLAFGLLVLIVGGLIVNWISRIVLRRMIAASEDPLMVSFFGRTIKFFLFTLLFLLVLRIIGFAGIASGLLAGAGVSAVVLGFAFKEIGENFIAGFILAFNRPFSVNDTIEVDNVFGRVKSLQFRYTHIKTFDGKDVYVPNADVITNPLVNYTADGYIRFDFSVGIAYEDKIEDAKKLIVSVMKQNTFVVDEPTHEAFVVEDSLGVSTMNLKVFFWVETMDYRQRASETKGDVIREVKEALEDNGFYLPADIQEIKLYGGNSKPLDLRVQVEDGTVSQVVS